MCDVNSVTISIERFKALENLEMNYSSRLKELENTFTSALKKDFIEYGYASWSDNRMYISCTLSKDEIFLSHERKIAKLEVLISKPWYKFWE